MADRDHVCHVPDTKRWSVGQARAASCQFLQSEKNAAQQRHATTNMAAAKGSDCRPGAVFTVSASVSSPTSHPSHLPHLGQVHLAASSVCANPENPNANALRAGDTKAMQAALARHDRALPRPTV